MRLYFLRHGQAEARDEWTAPDEERPLTADGITEMRAAAWGLRRLDFRLDLLLSSPLVRAQHTADIVGHALKVSVVTEPALSPGCTLEKLADVLARFGPASSGLKWGAVLVGHEPDLSTMIAALIAPSGDVTIDLRKGAICRVDVDAASDFRWDAENLRGCGMLEWLLTAKQLVQVGA
jgi:phosphohistidine phosphatase